MAEKVQSPALRAVVSGATGGNNTLVAAVSGKKIKVLELMLVVAGAVNIQLESGVGGAYITGLMTTNAAADQIYMPMSRPGYHHIETAQGTLLNMELSGAVQVSGWIVYYTEA